jgi:hypothetical protein
MLLPLISSKLMLTLLKRLNSKISVNHLEASKKRNFYMFAASIKRKKKGKVYARSG